jgi:hypothetical protein
MANLNVYPKLHTSGCVPGAGLEFNFLSKTVPAFARRVSASSPEAKRPQMALE